MATESCCNTPPGRAERRGFGEWHDHDTRRQHEWVVVLKGAAKVRFENEEVVDLRSGDFLYIPADQPHRVEWTTPDEPTIWLAVFYTT